MSEIRELKVWPIFYDDIESGVKTWEVRRDDAEGFAAGSTLLLREWDPAGGGYTGRECERYVSYVCSLHPIGMEGWIGMSLEPPAPAPVGETGDLLRCDNCGHESVEWKCPPVGETGDLLRCDNCGHESVEWKCPPVGETGDPAAGLPDELRVLFRDQSIVIPRDAEVFEMIVRSHRPDPNCPTCRGTGEQPVECATMSAPVPPSQMQSVYMCACRFKAAPSVGETRAHVRRDVIDEVALDETAGHVECSCGWGSSRIKACWFDSKWAEHVAAPGAEETRAMDSDGRPLCFTCRRPQSEHLGGIECAGETRGGVGAADPGCPMCGGTGAVPVPISEFRSVAACSCRFKAGETRGGEDALAVRIAAVEEYRREMLGDESVDALDRALVDAACAEDQRENVRGALRRAMRVADERCSLPAASQPTGETRDATPASEETGKPWSWPHREVRELMGELMDAGRALDAATDQAGRRLREIYDSGHRLADEIMRAKPSPTGESAEPGEFASGDSNRREHTQREAPTPVRLDHEQAYVPPDDAPGEAPSEGTRA